MNFRNLFEWLIVAPSDGSSSMEKPLLLLMVWRPSQNWWKQEFEWAWIMLALLLLDTQALYMCADCLYICAVGHCACRVVEWRLKVNGFRRKDMLPMRLWKSTSWSSRQSVSVNFLKHHHWQFLMDQLKWWLPEDLISQSNSFAKLEFLQCLCGTSAKLIWTICKSLLWTAVFYFELEQPVVGIIACGLRIYTSNTCLEVWRLWLVFFLR